jgi:hypothetical protein
VRLNPIRISCLLILSCDCCYFIIEAPTALALTTSLLSTALPRLECKKHVAFFSAATPFGALVSYGLFSFLDAGGEGDWTGTALLISVSSPRLTFLSLFHPLFTFLLSGRYIPLRSNSTSASFTPLICNATAGGHDQVDPSGIDGHGYVSPICYWRFVRTRTRTWIGERDYVTVRAVQQFGHFRGLLSENLTTLVHISGMFSNTEIWYIC